MFLARVLVWHWDSKTRHPKIVEERSTLHWRLRAKGEILRVVLCWARLFSSHVVLLEAISFEDGVAHWVLAMRSGFLAIHNELKTQWPANTTQHIIYLDWCWVTAPSSLGKANFCLRCSPQSTWDSTLIYFFHEALIFTVLLLDPFSLDVMGLHSLDTNLP